MPKILWRYCLCRILANNHRSQPEKRPQQGKGRLFAHYRRRLSELGTECNNTHHCNNLVPAVEHLDLEPPFDPCGFGRIRSRRSKSSQKSRKCPLAGHESSKLSGEWPVASPCPTKLLPTLTGSQRLHDRTAVDDQTGASNVAARLAGQ